MTTQKTVLVIEDDRSVAQMLRDVLEADGHRVLMEADGEWGLRAFERQHVDLVVLDVLVPKLVGFDLVHRLRQSEAGRNVPVIVLSGVYRASVHRAKMMEKYGILEYFDKPVDLDRFIYAVREVNKASDAPRTSDLPRMTADRSKAKRLLTIPPDVSALDAAETEQPARSPMIPPRPRNRGRIDQLPFARLLGQFYAARANGALMLRRSAIKKIVYMQDGIPVYVKSNLVSECLGRIMVREGLISEKECEESVERVKKEARKQGEVLVEMGSISPHNLDFALERQTEIKLYDLFGWIEGKYLFTDADHYDGPVTPSSMGPIAMIYEGVRRTMSFDRLRKDLESMEGMIMAPSDDPTFRYQALQLEPRAVAFLDAVDGTRTVREVIDGAGFDLEDATTLAYVLMNCGLIRVLHEPIGALQRPPALSRVPRPRPASVVQLDDQDVVELKTGEVVVDDPALAAIAAARRKAREAAEAALRSAADALKNDSESPDQIVRRTARESQVLAAAALPKLDLRLPPASTPIPDEVREALHGTGEHFIDAALQDALPIVPVPASTEAPSPTTEEAFEPPRPPAPIDDADTAANPARLEPPISQDILPALPRERRPSDEPSGDLPTQDTPRNGALPKVQGIDFERERARKLEELSESVSRLKSKNYYERLEVHRHARREEIERAHRKLAHEHHPDHVIPGMATPQIRVLAEEAFLLIRRAYEALSNAEEREDYDRSLGAPDGSDTIGIARAVAAEEAYREGMALTDTGDWEGAMTFFQRASEQNPGEGTYIAYLAWASFCADPSDPAVSERALTELDIAVDRSPLLEDAYVFRGLILEKLGRRDLAVGSLRQAIEVNPDSVRALRALRTIAPPAPKKTGFLARLGVGD